MFVIGVLFTLFLGPYCGVQIVMAAQEENLYVIIKSWFYPPPDWQSLISGLRSSQCDPLPLLTPHVALPVQAETHGVPPLDPGGLRLDLLRVGCLVQEGLHWESTELDDSRSGERNNPNIFLFCSSYDARGQCGTKYGNFHTSYLSYWPFSSRWSDPDCCLRIVRTARLPDWSFHMDLLIGFSEFNSKKGKYRDLPCLSCKTYLLFVQSDAVKLRYEYVAVDIYL